MDGYRGIGWMKRKLKYQVKSTLIEKSQQV